jgi:2-iminobutanoate/2-iminopropanoate deaminase
MMHRLRVEPYSSYLERRRKGPIYPVTIAGDFIFLSGLPPFERGTGEIKRLSFERQAEIVLMQMQKCLEAAGSSLAKVLKCNVYCTPEPAHFAMFNDITHAISRVSLRRASSCTSLLSPARSISKLIAWRSFSYGGNGRLCPLLAQSGHLPVSVAAVIFICNDGTTASLR